MILNRNLVLTVRGSFQMGLRLRRCQRISCSVIPAIQSNHIVLDHEDVRCFDGSTSLEQVGVIEKRLLPEQSSIVLKFPNMLELVLGQSICEDSIGNVLDPRFCIIRMGLRVRMGNEEHEIDPLSLLLRQSFQQRAYGCGKISSTVSSNRGHPDAKAWLGRRSTFVEIRFGGRLDKIIRLLPSQGRVAFCVSSSGIKEEGCWITIVIPPAILHCTGIEEYKTKNDDGSSRQSRPLIHQCTEISQVCGMFWRREIKHTAKAEADSLSALKKNSPGYIQDHVDQTIIWHVAM